MKPYAADFCGVKTLRDATREQVENFVSASCRLGRERPQCPALPAQQLHARQRKVPHETPIPRLASRLIDPRMRGARRNVPRSRRASPVSLARSKALLHPPSRPSSNLRHSRAELFPAASTAPPKHYGNSAGSFATSVTTLNLLGRDEVDERISSDFAAWSRSVTPFSTALHYSTSTVSLPPASGKSLGYRPLQLRTGPEAA